MANGILTQSEKERLEMVRRILEEIDSSSRKISTTIRKGISVNNLDEVRASLVNQFNNLNKNLNNLFEQVSSSQQMHRELLEDVSLVLEQIKQKTKRRQRFEIDNLDEIQIPKNITVDNLSDMQPFFDSLSEVVKSSLKIDLPEPKVNVEAPVVNIPETKIDIPPLDLSKLLTTIKTSLNKLSSNSKTRPLAVRMTDGQNWIQAVRQLAEDTKVAFQGFSENVRLRNKKGLVVSPATEDTLATVAAGVGVASLIADGFKNVSSAGTAETLVATSTSCKRVYIKAKVGNTGSVYVGGSTVDNTRGIPLLQAERMELEIDDVQKVYVDADNNNDGVTFTYVN